LSKIRNILKLEPETPSLPN